MKYYTKGFTIVEALVAISILVIVISGGFVAVSNSLRNATLSKEQITAFFLAQEGMEAVRYQRDSNGLNSGSAWNEGLTTTGAPCLAPRVCYVDATTLPDPTFVFCGNDWGTCPVIENNSSNHLYNYSGDPTPFRREVRITPLTGIPHIDDGNVLQVEVRVGWQHNNEDKEFVTSGLLYNWQKYEGS